MAPAQEGLRHSAPWQPSFSWASTLHDLLLGPAAVLDGALHSGPLGVIEVRSCSLGAGSRLASSLPADQQARTRKEPGWGAQPRRFHRLFSFGGKYEWLSLAFGSSQSKVSLQGGEDIGHRL